MNRHEELKSQGSAAAALGARSGPPTNGEAPKVGRSDVKNWVSWAQKHVTGEHPHLAAQAAAMLHFTGQTVTVGAVRTRLRETGRDARTLKLGEAA